MQSSLKFSGLRNNLEEIITDFFQKSPEKKRKAEQMKKAIFAVIMICMIAFVGCGKTDLQYQKQYIGAFDTVTIIIGYAANKEAFATNADLLYEKLCEYHELFDIYNTYDGINNIKTINDNAGIASVTVDNAIIELLEFSVDMYELTGGKMNIAMGSVLKIWHEYRQNGINSPDDAELPYEAELKSAAEHTNIENLIIDKEKNTVYISDPMMSLDVGATAKGYAVEKVCEYAESKGIGNISISCGGNVCTVGKKADGTDWNVGIVSPFGNNNEYIRSVKVHDAAVVTSGTYQRYYEVDGKKYHHIIDPETLMPSELYLSVSIISKSSAESDALSTALFNMPIDESKRLIESLEYTDAVWILADGSIVISSGLSYNSERELKVQW